MTSASHCATKWNAHLDCSEAFDVQLKDGRRSELVNDVF